MIRRALFSTTHTSTPIKTNMKYLPYLVALGSLSPIPALAQEPSLPPPVSVPAPLAPPAPAVPPNPPDAPRPPQARSRSGVFLGVEVSRVPAVLSEQLNLPEGFGVLVEYVVPGSAAETAGVKPHDILKLVNDQIITGSEQLSVLVHSFSDGQPVTLVVLHKGQEAKLTATVRLHASRDADRDDEKRSRRSRWEHSSDGDNSYWYNFNEFPSAESTERLQQQMDRNRTQIEAATNRALEQAKHNLEDARERSASATASRLDFDRAHVVLRDATGRIELRIAHNKRSLKVRDAQGKIVFDGPIDTPEQRKAIPADMLPKVEALEKERETVFRIEDGVDADKDRDAY